MKVDTAYTIFGLSKNVVYSGTFIRKIYKKLCLKYHPDKRVLDEGNSAQACSYFILINKAYSIVTIHNGRISNLFSSGNPEVDAGIEDILRSNENTTVNELFTKFNKVLEIYKSQNS